MGGLRGRSHYRRGDDAALKSRLGGRVLADAGAERETCDGLGQMTVGAGAKVALSVLACVVFGHYVDEPAHARGQVRTTNLADQVGAERGLKDGAKVLVDEDDVDVEVGDSKGEGFDGGGGRACDRGRFAAREGLRSE